MLGWTHSIGVRNYPQGPPRIALTKFFIYFSSGLNAAAIIAGIYYGNPRGKINPRMDASGYGNQRMVS